MTVIKEKPTVNCNKPAVEKYGGYILPFDHFNNLTVYSRIWKNLPQDRYDYMCGKIVLQTEGLQQRMNTTTCSDILAGVKIDCGNTRKVGILLTLFTKPTAEPFPSFRWHNSGRKEKSLRQWMGEQPLKAIPVGEENFKLLRIYKLPSNISSALQRAQQKGKREINNLQENLAKKDFYIIWRNPHNKIFPATEFGLARNNFFKWVFSCTSKIWSLSHILRS